MGQGRRGGGGGGWEGMAKAEYESKRDNVCFVLIYIIIRMHTVKLQWSMR